MSRQIRRAVTTVQSTTSSLAFNPLVTSVLLYTLTKGPASIRDRLISSISVLRDPDQRSTVVKALKWLLALGLISKANKVLNHIALNAWRVKKEKMRWEWNKEVAVVTGGCSGIGELIVKGLERKGCKVAVLDVQGLPKSLENYAKIKFFECDITNPAAVREVAESVRSSLGPPSILVNNAGIADAHTILDTSDEWLRKQFDVNLLSHWYTTKAFLPDMVAKDKGHIVSIASLASYVGVGGMVDYCSTKAGVLAFHEGLSQELKHKYKAPNVLTTSVHPNWVRTPLVAVYEHAFKGARILKPEDVANAVVQQIVSCSGAQLIIPEKMSNASYVRAFPNWLQESTRDKASKAVIGRLAL